MIECKFEIVKNAVHNENMAILVSYVFIQVDKNS